MRAKDTGVGPVSVLYFTNALVRGGAEEHMLTLMRGLDRGRFQVHLACSPEVAAVLRPDLPADVNVEILRLRSPRDLTGALRLATILRKHRVDILHSHLFYASLFASPIGWACRVPAIIETPHLREAWRTTGWKASFVVDRTVGHLVDRYIAVSEANARYLVDEKGLRGGKVVVVHNGCDVERFDPGHRPPSGMRRALGFEDSDPVLVVAARLEPQKGHRFLLDALPGIRHEFPSVRLVCVGEGSLRTALERQVEENGLHDAVRFVGFQSNVADWLALADVVVLPSLFEGLPLVAIEALSAARAVVASAVDGTPEVVVHERTGLTVPPGQAGALAEATCRLLHPPDLRDSLGAAGRRWVLEHFRREAQVRRTEEVYLSVLGRARGRSLVGRSIAMSPPLPEQKASALVDARTGEIS